MSASRELVVKFTEARCSDSSGSALGSADDRDLERWLEQAARVPDVPIVIDLTGSSYADSARLSKMLKLRKSVDSARRVGILAPDPALLKMLQRCHVDRVIPVFALMDDARAGLTT